MGWGVADLEVVWGDLGGEGGGTQGACGNLVEHASDEAAVCGVLLCLCCSSIGLLFISTDSYSSTQSEAA